MFHNSLFAGAQFSQLDQYQEKPHLLDKDLESLVTPIVEKIRSITQTPNSTASVGNIYFATTDRMVSR